MTPASMIHSIQQQLRCLSRFMRMGIWDYTLGTQHPLLAKVAAVLRVMSISLRGLQENSLFSRAASLSYASMLALGPLIALSVVITGALMPTDTEQQIKRVLLFIAPSLQELASHENSNGTADAEMVSALDALLVQIVDGAQAIINQVNTGGSKLFGAIGSLILIWIVIQLLTSVETTLNRIWGVRHGRPWSQRIVFYWSFISLGVLLGLGSTALISASSIASLFEWAPYSAGITALLLWSTPLLSFLMLVLLLALFYRFFPNTTVRLHAAFTGALVAAVMLFLNNYLSILYVHRVISLQSLYGSVGIIPVLMFGLYFFWVFVLLGGQITYAAQNAHFLNDTAAWRRISPRAFELVTLGAFMYIARCFHRCEGPPDIQTLGAHLHVPQSTLNEAIENLEELGWVTRVSAEDNERSKEKTAFQPAKPLEAYTLARFRTAIASVGHCDIARSFIDDDPLLQQYDRRLADHLKDEFFQMNLRAQLLAENSVVAQP